MKMIELHCCDWRRTVDVDRIVAVVEGIGGCSIYLDTKIDAVWCVDEGYDEVMGMIEAAMEEPAPEDFTVPGFLTEGGGGNAE